jgi:hypothetical protein
MLLKLSWLLILLLAAPSLAQPHFDLTQPDQAKLWTATHDISSIEPTAQGILIHISGPDPYLTGPRANYPANTPLWLSIRLKSQEEGSLQVFYFKDGPREENSIRIPIRANVWEDLKVPFKPLGPGYRLRIDPPGQGGSCLISSISFEERKPFSPPAWPKPTSPDLSPDSPKITSGDLTLTHSKTQFGGFTLTSNAQSLAIGQNQSLLGFTAAGQEHWLNLQSQGKLTVITENQAILSTLTVSDDQGAVWTLSQRFSPDKHPGTINVDAQISSDHDRDLIYAPLIAIHPGVGSFGQSKTQALFPGLEYLDKDEPSSSEADLAAPQSQRQVPDQLKITFPLMAILANGHYVGLVYDRNPNLAAVFDSPDREFKSTGHVMALISPGSNGANRAEGNLLPHFAKHLPANQILKAHATFIAGQAQSIIPAVQHYLTLHPLPKAPTTLALDDYVKLTAAGWLDSKIREGNHFRHALGSNFAAHPAADAALMIDWLAGQTADNALAARLKETSAAALADVPPGGYNSASIGHVRYPSQALIYGHIPENLDNARRHAQSLIQQFQPDGTLLYRPGKVNYGKTHFAPGANGNTASNVAFILEAAALTGDEKLIADGVRLLHAMDKFTHSVPRGAQTWEMPLHTPDILASGYLVKAYCLGYQLTGDPSLLETARYWAYTGLPFLYLDNPIADTNPAPIALPYAVIAVFGATNWQAPNWLGLPVQWCGLVYSDSLYRLSILDDSFPWRQVADGITASGINQSVPMSGPIEKRGLLPDSFQLRREIRQDPLINPATVQADAIQFFTKTPLYQFVSARDSGLLIHAPGAITQFQQSPKTIQFVFTPALPKPCTILISRCKSLPKITINDKPAEPASIQFSPENSRLLLTVARPATIKLEVVP